MGIEIIFYVGIVGYIFRKQGYLKLKVRVEYNIDNKHDKEDKNPGFFPKELTIQNKFTEIEAAPDLKHYEPL